MAAKPVIAAQPVIRPLGWGASAPLRAYFGGPWTGPSVALGVAVGNHNPRLGSCEPGKGAVSDEDHCSVAGRGARRRSFLPDESHVKARVFHHISMQLANASIPAPAEIAVLDNQRYYRGLTLVMMPESP
jgi:hypothetical protein